MGIMITYHGIIMGIIIPYTMCTKTWVCVIHGSTLYTAKYSKLCFAVYNFLFFHNLNVVFLFLFIYFQRQKGGRKRDRNINVWLPLAPPTGNLAHNLDMCPGWKLNQRPFGSQVGTQSIELHQPRSMYFLFRELSFPEGWTFSVANI